MNEPSASSAVVDMLLQAHRGGPAADDTAALPLVAGFDEAYAIQERLYAALGNPEGVPRWWKSGGPGRNDPMRHAPLPAAGVRPSGASLQGLHLRHRWIEAEVAVRLGRDVTPAEAQQLAPEQATALVDAMCVTIELVDTRWAGGRMVAGPLKVADLGVHGALVVGEFVPFAPRDWAQQECRVRIGQGGWQVFRGSLSIGDPAWLVPEWLRHLTRAGATVPAGTAVTAGTWCGLLEAAAGDEVVVEFPGVGAARVTV